MLSQKYIRIARKLGTTGFESIVLEPDKNPTHYINDPSIDHYSSIFKYTEEHYAHFKKFKTVKGLVGLKTNRLVFDFDDASDIEQARKDSVEACTRLIEAGVPQDMLRICFSGKKGFGVEVGLFEDISNTEFKNIVFNLAQDLKTFDTTVQDNNRLMRVPMTRHQSTKCYKFPVTLQQLSDMPIDVMKEMACDMDNVDEEITDSWGDMHLTPKLLELKDISPTKSIKTLDIVPYSPEEVDFKKCPKWLSKEKYALMQGFFDDGERNDALMILASTFKGQGFPKDVVGNMLKATARLREERIGTSYSKSEIWNQVITPIFSPGWNGGVYGKDHPLLVKTRAAFSIKEDITAMIITNGDMLEAFVDYASNIDENTIKTGLPIDENIRITTGMAVALLGGPSAGKTTVLLNILRNTSKTGTKSLFFSMDMHRALIMQKQLQLIHGETADTIYKNIKDPKKVQNYLESLNENFGNVSYCTKAGLTIEEIRHEIEIQKEKMGGALKLVTIDYLECIRGPYADATSNSAIIADGIKNIAVELDLCVILLVQPPKITGGAAYPLTNMYQIKGSSVVAQAMRVVVGIYREGFSPDTMDNDKYITFAGLKNSMGQLFTKDCKWDGAKGTISELTWTEEDDLAAFRKELEQKRVVSGL